MVLLKDLLSRIEMHMEALTNTKLMYLGMIASDLGCINH